MTGSRCELVAVVAVGMLLFSCEHASEALPGSEASSLSSELSDRRTPQISHLRSTPTAVSKSQIIQMIRDKGFHHPAGGRSVLARDVITDKIEGRFVHQYEAKKESGDEVVVDRATGLMWQRGGSKQSVSWNEAKGYIDQLNENRLAGFADWRLPTIEELASLLEPGKNDKTGLYVDPIFDSWEAACWSADTDKESVNLGAAWYVVFTVGSVESDDKGRATVRAVRTSTTSPAAVQTRPRALSELINMLTDEGLTELQKGNLVGNVYGGTVQIDDVQKSGWLGSTARILVQIGSRHAIREMLAFETTDLNNAGQLRRGDKIRVTGTLMRFFDDSKNGGRPEREWAEFEQVTILERLPGPNEK